MRLLILGTGGMANTHAQHFAAIDGVALVGAVDVDPSRAKAFADLHGIPCIPVHHHAAHVGVVAAERGVVKPLLGLALDGGLGDQHR